MMLMFMLFQLFQLQQNQKGNKATFNAGLFLGLAVSLSPLLIILLPFIYFMVLVIRPFILRELLLLICGFLLPFIYLTLFIFVFEVPSDFTFSPPETTLDQFPLEGLITLVFVCLLFLISLFAVNSSHLKSSIRSKNLLEC